MVIKSLPVTLGESVHSSEEVWQVLRHFPIAGAACQLVESDGFSGARLWRVADGARHYCLRRWPEGTDPARVSAINTVLVQADLPFIPRPVVANSLQSVVIQGSYAWTLQPWMAGHCIAKLPPPQDQLRNGMQALAQFHRSTEICGFTDQAMPPQGTRAGPPSGLQSRITLAVAYLQHKLQAIARAHVPSQLTELQPRRERLLSLFLELAPRLVDESRAVLQRSVALQPCIRDIHAGHVLFTSDHVTGLIDFDAMRVDHVATDLARLLGSFCGDDFELWEFGLAAYEEIRPLSRYERNLVVHYDRLAVLLTGLQWLDWMLLEGKQFELERVLPRIDATLGRLEHLRQNLRIGTGLA
jgi:hypothetical protein